MLVFVVPLMCPEVANSWPRVLKLLERCLGSIFNQTSANFRVVIVCNQKPEIQFTHPHLNYLEVDFQPIGSDVIAKTLDRGYRVLKGLVWARQYEPSYVMFVDADDCISKHLVEYTELNHHCNGWFIQRGFMYKEDSSFIYLQKKFNSICGTCNIIKTELYELDPVLLSDQDFMLNYYGRHTYITEHLNKQGIVIEPFPFNGAVYTIENGENYYCTRFDRYIPKKIIPKLKSMRNYRLLTQEIRDEFSLHQIQQKN